MATSEIDPASVGALVLAGGQGSRMGGLDKGLQIFQGRTLTEIAVQRLRLQTGGAPGQIAISANRNLARYAALGLPVWPDSMADFAGPLAGFLCALRQCQPRFDYVLSVPCDSPLFPLDLLPRLSHALLSQQADIAMPLAPETQADGSIRLHPQPVFCLMRTHLADSLQAFMDAGGRKIGAWTASHRQTKVAFDGPGDGARAFANANTLDDLRLLEKV